MCSLSFILLSYSRLTPINFSRISLGSNWRKSRKKSNWMYLNDSATFSLVTIFIKDNYKQGRLVLWGFLHCPLWELAQTWSKARGSSVMPWGPYRPHCELTDPQSLWEHPTSGFTWKETSTSWWENHPTSEEVCLSPLTLGMWASNLIIPIRWWRLENQAQKTKECNVWSCKCTVLYLGRCICIKLG